MKYKQRGNITDCVQWTGYNLDEVKEFIQTRLRGTFAKYRGSNEYIVTLLRHLIIVHNLDVEDAIILGKMVIPRNTWLVDQGGNPDEGIGFVICDPERFHTLYKEIGDDDG